MHDDRRDDTPDPTATGGGDAWTGSLRRPWLNPPSRRGGSGATRGSWRFAVGTLTLLVVAGFVVLVLVDQGVLPSGWRYVGLPVAGFCAVVAFVLTVLKARSATRA